MNNDLERRFVQLYWYAPSLALWRGVEARVVKDAIESISLKRPILELGCGDGLFAREVFSSPVDVGVDLSMKALRRAKGVQAYRLLLDSDAARLPMASEAIGTVFSNSAIEHMSNLSGVLRETVRVLRPSGYFIFTVPTNHLAESLWFARVFSRWGLHRASSFYGKYKNQRKLHINCFGVPQWTRMLAGVGLDVVLTQACLTERTVSTWDLFDTMSIGYGKYRVTALVRRISTTLEKWGINSLQRMGSLLLWWTLHSLFDVERNRSGGVGAGALLVARKQR